MSYPTRWALRAVLGLPALSLASCSPDAGDGDLGVRIGPAIGDVRGSEPEGGIDAGFDAAARDAQVADDAGDARAPSRLAFRVVTSSLRGDYAPRNVGAIWIESATGEHVKTLARWAGSRQRYLTEFMSASGGDAADAITSATLARHGLHEVRWDLTDKLGAPVVDGVYRLRLQMTEDHSRGAVGQISFVKGKLPITVAPPDQPGFSGMRLRYE